MRPRLQTRTPRLEYGVAGSLRAFIFSLSSEGTSTLTTPHIGLESAVAPERNQLLGDVEEPLLAFRPSKQLPPPFFVIVEPPAALRALGHFQ